MGTEKAGYQLYSVSSGHMGRTDKRTGTIRGTYQLSYAEEGCKCYGEPVEIPRNADQLRGTLLIRYPAFLKYYGNFFEKIMGKMNGTRNGVLVQEMVKGHRELAIGLTRDPQCGPYFMFRIGGIFTEILKDVSFRAAPLEKKMP